MKKFINWITGPKSDFVLLIILLVLINLVGANSFFRLDLTSPKSYSLSQSSKEVVKNLEEPLSGDFFFNCYYFVMYLFLNLFFSEKFQTYKMREKSNKIYILHSDSTVINSSPILF